MAVPYRACVPSSMRASVAVEFDAPFPFLVTTSIKF